MNVKAIAAAAALLFVGGLGGAVFSSPAKTACLADASRSYFRVESKSLWHVLRCATDRIYAMEYTYTNGIF